MADFEIVSPHEPSGDQPEAIKQLTEGLRQGQRHQVLLGATGTGKSVFLNALLCSLFFKATPERLKLLLIDPKLLEFSVYEGIPHLISEVVTNPRRAAADRCPRAASP